MTKMGLLVRRSGRRGISGALGWHCRSEEYALSGPWSAGNPTRNERERTYL